MSLKSENSEREKKHELIFSQDFLKITKSLLCLKENTLRSEIEKEFCIKTIFVQKVAT